MESHEDFSPLGALFVFFMVLILGIAILDVPSAPAYQQPVSQLSSETVSSTEEKVVPPIPEEKRPLSQIPWLELARLFDQPQQKSLESEIERVKHDSNALVRIVSVKNMGFNGNATDASPASQIWKLTVPQVRELIQKKQTLLTLLTQFQTQLQETSISFVPSSYAYETILEDIRLRPMIPSSESPTPEEQILTLARKIAETCIPSQEKGY